VVLGDIYLELGQYENAAKCFYQYLRYAGLNNPSDVSVYQIQPMSTVYSDYSPIFRNFTEWPADYNAAKNNTLYTGSTPWYNYNSVSDVISYIPMAVNYTTGQTTDIPATFGYNFYGTERRDAVETEVDFTIVPNTEFIQVVPSQAYCDSARRAQYYYYTEQVKVSPFNWIVKSEPLGDARAYLVNQGSGADSSYVYLVKPSMATINLYRNSTVWLHLAEAINRMGYPDAAFAVLKNGLHSELANFRYLEVYMKDQLGNDSINPETGQKVLDMTQSHVDDKYYLTPRSYELLTTTLPFLSQANSDIFRNGATKSFIGIHFRGAGAVEDLYSSYRYNTVLKAKIDDIYQKFNLGTPKYDEADYMNAMEDLLCDEYAMEFAFEGCRYSDLRRLALHKNQAATYGAGFGDTWLSRMLQNNAAGITTQNCYLPYK
jgi:hypothetical protein